jgi:colanic acid/amylovoran biosynthesis glycosyltransferase
MKNQVGIFRTVYPLVSETFITEQAAALKEFQPQMIMRDCVDLAACPSAIYLAGGLARSWWTLTRAAQCFPVTKLAGVQLIHAHFGQDAVMALPLARKLGVPLITTFHGADITVNARQRGFRPRPTELHFAWHEAELKRDGSRFIAVSKFIAAKLIERGYESKRVRQIYIGVDLNKFSPIDPADKSNERYLLCVGRHTAKKGIDKLVAAWALVAHKHPEIMLKQVGSGGVTQELKALAAEFGIEHRIEWMGAQAHLKVRSLMQNAEAFVLPSQTAANGDSEALGIVFNEASACAIPVISTRHGGIPEAVLHGQTGLLSIEGDVKELAEHIDAILSDRDLGRRLGLNGQEWVQESFDIRKQTKLLEQLYVEAIDEA